MIESRSWKSPWAFAWAALVGMSRLLLMVHFPSDILAGAALGVVVATLGLSLSPF
jgi:undecaprenyl-diphosphatase